MFIMARFGLSRVLPFCIFVSARSISVLNASEPFVVWNTMDSNCEKVMPGTPIDLPDTPPNAFVDGRGMQAAQ